MSNDGWNDLGVCGCCQPYYPYYPYGSSGDGRGPLVPTACCPGGTPKILYGTLVNQTGTCADYTPISWVFYYIEGEDIWRAGDAPDPPAGQCQAPSLIGCLQDYVLQCIGDTWFLGRDPGTAADCATGVEGPCDPFFKTFTFTGGDTPPDCDLSLPGILCNGTYQVIVTE